MSIVVVVVVVVLAEMMTEVVVFLDERNVWQGLVLALDSVLKMIKMMME